MPRLLDRLPRDERTQSTVLFLLRSSLNFKPIPALSARRVLTRPHPNPAQVHRLLENEEITPDDVLGLRDSLEYYLEQNQNPDFVFDDTMYEELPMDKLDAKVGEELTSRELLLEIFVSWLLS